MKITKLSLTNFRSFKETQVIEIAPVTLLFGPNSVGKSSVLMALAYLHQILRKGHCDPQRLDALGDKVIGGFKSLVYGQDLAKSIIIKIDYMNSGLPPYSYESDSEELGNQLGLPFLQLPDYDADLIEGSISFEISWSNRFKRAYVKKIDYWANGSFLAVVVSSEDLRRTEIQDLNLDHLLLSPTNYFEWHENEYGYEPNGEVVNEDEWLNELEQVLSQLNPTRIPTPHQAAPISIKCQYGAVPLLGQPIITSFRVLDFQVIEDRLNYMALESVLSQAIVCPLDRLLKYLTESVQIGPLRLVPDHEYVPNPHPEQKDWMDGSAAWDLLYKDPNSDKAINRLIKSTSEWFASSDKLDAGYEIINQSIAETLNVRDSEDDVGLLNKRHVLFKELRSDILLSANQLGTGISQVLPIVVAANYDSVGLISVEQPELHIHPRFQVELADVFLRAKDKHVFLIETHSEHIVLRLLRRIRQRESNDGNLSIDEVSIMYLTPTSEGTRSKRLVITLDGDFESDWPHGFFDEREGELF